MATHSSTLAWKIPQMEEPGRLQSMGSLRVGHNWAASLYFSLSCIGEENGTILQYSCLENPRDRGAWWAAVYRVAQGWMWLKRLSSISSRWQTSSLGELKQLLITYKALQTRNGNRGHMDLRLSLISSIRQNLKPREKNDKVAVQATGNAPSAKLFKE